MPTPVEATVTLASLVQRVSSHFLENPNWITVTLADVNDLVATVDDGTKVEIGDLINVGRPGVDTGNELLLVKSIAANEVTVARGMYGSTPAAATAVLSYVNPRYTTKQIEQTISDTCDSLFPYCWTAVNVEITLTTSADYYALPTDFIEVISGIQKLDDGSYLKYGRGSYLLTTRNLPTDDFTNNTVLYVPTRVASATNPLNLFYRAKITTSNVSDGLMARTIEYGSVADLMGMVQAQTAGETSPLSETNAATVATMQGVSWYKREFNEKRDMLRNKCLKLWPPARKWSN
jgi:hypothetical protein